MAMWIAWVCGVHVRTCSVNVRASEKVHGACKVLLGRTVGGGMVLSGFLDIYPVVLEMLIALSC